MAKFQRFIDIALIFYSYLLRTSLLFISIESKNILKDDYLKLRLVSTIFRHGDRIVNRFCFESYPNDPHNNYNFYPISDGQLTNVGKKRIYELGLMLRKKYNSFLGDMYYPPNVYARSTEISRAKMSLQLVLAALYPPVDIQKWNSELSWQPIDMIYFSTNEDDLFTQFNCLKYIKIYNNVLQRAEVKEKIKKFDDLMKRMSNYTGQNITNLLDLYTLYTTLCAQSSMELILPEWTQTVFPNGELLNAILLLFELRSYDQLNSLNGGVLLKRIIDDMNKVINGTLDRKINLFSVHDINVAALLFALNIFERTVYPEFTSSVIIELYEGNDKYFVKVLYYFGIPSKVLELNIPGCEILCPYDKFIELTKETVEGSKQCCPKNNQKTTCDLISNAFI